MFFTLSVKNRILIEKNFRNIGKLIFSEKVDCNKAGKFAKSDIKNGLPTLLLAGGIAPLHILTDVDFKNEFRFMTMVVFNLRKSVWKSIIEKNSTI